ncbi:MAG: PP2C family protein-serine/threonine phosphatase [Gammaproteobacteria bacterium]
MDKFSFDLTGIFREGSNYKNDDYFHRLVKFSVTNCVAAIVIATILWSSVKPQWLLIWVSLIFSISISRVLLVYFCKKNDHLAEEAESLHVAALVLILFMGIIWGSLAYIYDSNWSVVQQTSVVGVLMLKALAAIPAYAAILQVYAISLIAILSPLAAVFLYSDQDEFLFNGSVFFVLTGTLIILAKCYHRMFSDEYIENTNNPLFINDVNGSISERVMSNYSKEPSVESNAELLLRTPNKCLERIANINLDLANIQIIPGIGSSHHFIYTDITPHGETYILFADFSVHGPSAKLIDISVSSAFYAMVAEGSTIEEILSKIDSILYIQLPEADFCRASFISLNFNRSKMKLWNGGFPDILIITGNGKSVDRYPSIHIPLGLEAGLHQKAFEEIDLSKGDLVFCCTEGLVDILGGSVVDVGINRLEELLIKNYFDQSLIKGVEKAASKWDLKNNMLVDEISMLEIRN